MSDRQAHAPGGSRLARLDGLRGLSAITVVLCHLAFFHQSEVAALPLGLGRLLGWFAGAGWTFVDLFFVISGYVFAHVYGAPGQLRRPGALSDFWVARFARLWPLHVGTLVAMAVFAWGGANDLPHFLLHLTMLQGLEIGHQTGFNPASWSLSLEMMDYALFVLGAWAGDRVLLWISVLAVVGNAWWLLVMGIPGGPWLGEVIPRGLLGFFTGQLLWRGRGWLASCPWPVLVGMVIVGWWLVRGAYSPLLPLGLLAWPAALLLALRMPMFGRGWLAWLGARSFGIYMIHLPVFDAFDSIGLFAGQGWGGFLGREVLALGTVLLCAELAFHRIEMPARRLIRAGWAARARGGSHAVAMPEASAT